MARKRPLPLHLERRGPIYHWRRRTPIKDGEKIFGSAFLSVSLRTDVLRDAVLLARRLTWLSDEIFARTTTERDMAIAPHIAEHLLESLARFEIDAFERTRAMADPRTPEAAELNLRREEALQTTLRQALYLGNREVARAPLAHVATQLGIALDETDPDWKALAYEATKVLLDVSRERRRRMEGVYDEPTAIFRTTMRNLSAPSNTSPCTTSSRRQDVPPAGFAADFPISTEKSTLVSFSATVPVATLNSMAAPAEPVASTGSDTVSTAPVETEAVPTPTVETEPEEIILPAGMEKPAGMDAAIWQQARIAARPPRLYFDRKLLSAESRSALEKQRGITLKEAIQLYYELKAHGYSGPFDAQQKRKSKPRSTHTVPWEDLLSNDDRSKFYFAMNFWADQMGECFVDEIENDEVNEALDLLWSIPANHGRSQQDRDTLSLREIIEKADEKEARGKTAIKIAQARGASDEEIDRIRLETTVERLSVATFIKHGRVMRAVGRMLYDMQLIDHNPFSICSWSNAEVKELQRNEGSNKREAWDDRIHRLFGSRVFTEPLEDVGDPLFWAPLIARHQGLRMEECLQLGPEDFGTDAGIPYLRVRQTIINGVKTLSSERTLPIHPNLIELGLLKLVELRRNQGHIRLFPFLKRGKQKGTFTANFSKAFGYYRRTNHIYWRGLDFHALRTTFHNDLLSDGKSDAIRCRLMGHARTDEGDRSYGQSLGIKALAERMASVVVDISMVRNPFATATTEADVTRQHLRVVA